MNHWRQTLKRMRADSSTYASRFFATSIQLDRNRTAFRLWKLRKQAKQNRAAKIQVEALDRAFLEAFKRLLQSHENIDENKFGIRLGK